MNLETFQFFTDRWKEAVERDKLFEFVYRNVKTDDGKLYHIAKTLKKLVDELPEYRLLKITS
jgi:DNA-binding winged helix-turn-helix (wHTH) protein